MFIDAIIKHCGYEFMPKRDSQYGQIWECPGCSRTWVEGN